MLGDCDNLFFKITFYILLIDSAFHYIDVFEHQFVVYCNLTEQNVIYHNTNSYVSIEKSGLTYKTHTLIV